MPITIDPAVRTALLGGSYRLRYVADAYYGAMPVLLGMPLAKAGSLKAKAGSRIQTSGTLYLVDRPFTVDGRTIAPKAMRDIFAPFGQEIDLRVEILIGSRLIGSISLGRFRITDVPSIEQTARRLARVKLPQAVSLELTLKDRFDKLDADFTSPTGPLPGSTSWSEIARHSLVPIVRNRPDKSLPASLVYADNRLDAIITNMTNLDADPHLNRQGALTSRPTNPLVTNDTVTTDLTGTIRDLTGSMSNKLYNAVVVKAAGSGANQIVGYAAIEDGPLSVHGELGPRVYTFSSPLDATLLAADLTAATLLRRMSRSQAKQVTANILPQPFLELGDVVRVTDPNSDRVELGIIDEINYSLNATDLMQITITIPNEVIPWA